MDTAKAFDSIDHEYIRSILKKQNFPKWFRHIVKNLLTNVKSRPIMAESEVDEILIERGVKQGCPLSPILFILAYDPLIRIIKNMSPNITIRAAADDIAISSPCLSQLTKTMERIDQFREISGLGVNEDKTKVLSARPHKRSDRLSLEASRWPLVKIVEEYRYLGILFGRKVWVENIYRDVMEKAETRALLYAKVLRDSSIQTRIIIFNVFIVSLFSYVAQFFVVPITIYDRFKKMARLAIIPYHGTGFKYLHLVTTKKDLGFRQPIRDLWAHNIKLLTVRSNIKNWRSRDEMTTEITEDSMLISEWRNFAATEFANQWSTWDKTFPIEINNLETYETLINKAFKKDRLLDLGRKLTKFDYPRSEANRLASLLNEHSKLVATDLPSISLAHQISLITRTTPTDCRTRFFSQQSQARDPTNDIKCKLCEKNKDRIEHIYGECEVVNRALEIVSETLPNNDAMIHMKTSSKFKFLFDFTSETRGSKETINMMMIFNWVVWKVITLVKAGGFTERAHQLIADRTIEIWERKHKKG